MRQAYDYWQDQPGFYRFIPGPTHAVPGSLIEETAERCVQPEVTKRRSELRKRRQSRPKPTEAAQTSNFTSSEAKENLDQTMKMKFQTKKHWTILGKPTFSIKHIKRACGKHVQSKIRETCGKPIFSSQNIQKPKHGQLNIFKQQIF